MSFFGLTDPYIWGSYIACFLTVVLCVGYYMYHKNNEEDDEDE